MTIKIKATKALGDVDRGIAGIGWDANHWSHVRIVRESDWRKLMRLVKVVDEHTHADPWKTCDICEALAALSKEKKK